MKKLMILLCFVSGYAFANQSDVTQGYIAPADAGVEEALLVDYLPCAGGEARTYAEAFQQFQAAFNSCHSQCRSICYPRTHTHTGGNVDQDDPPYAWSVTCVCR